MREQLPPLVGNQVNRLDDVVEDLLRDEVIEIHPRPPRLDALAAAKHFFLEGMGGGDIDSE